MEATETTIEQSTEAAPPAAPAAAPATGQSLLAANADTPKPINELIPEKFRVVKDGGEFDMEASTRKVLEAHSNLEKRLGSGDAPPKSADDYKIEGLPEHINIDELKKDEKFQGFLKSAHGKGLSNAQVSFVLNEYVSRLDQMPSGQFTYEQAQAELGKVWKGEEMDTNLRAAARAATGLAQRAGLSAQEIEAAGLSNNPVFFRMLAALGPSMSEDSPPNSQDTTQAERLQIAEARSKLGSMSEKDPQYPALRKQVDDWYRKTYGTAPVA